MKNISNKVSKEAIELWRKHCEEVQSATYIIEQESPKEKEARISNLLKDFRKFVLYYFPHHCIREDAVVVNPAEFHIKASKDIKTNTRLKAAYVWHRGAAKSTYMDIFIPLWLKAQKRKEINVMVLVGKSETNAKTLLGDLQAELQYNQRYISDFGEQYNAGSWENGRFITKDSTAFFALGRGQSPRGLRYRNNRPDYIVIDDLDDDELVENPSRVAQITRWVKEALFGALDAGRGRFIMVGNLISQNSVLHNIMKSKGVVVSKVNIVNEKGEIAWKEKYNWDEIRDLEEFMGYRSFQKEYMNNPMPEGAVFRSEWIRYKALYPLKSYDKFVLYIDPSFKGGTKNDYKACKLWGRKGNELHCIKAFVRQCSIGEMIRWLYDLYEWAESKGIVIEFWMEANFIQDMILDDIEEEGNIRGYQLPIRKDKRKKPDKYQRIEQSSVYWERAFVYYNEDEREDSDMQRGIEQTLSFEKGMRGHDDAPDADEGAIYLLQKGARASNKKPLKVTKISIKNASW